MASRYITDSLELTIPTALRRTALTAEDEPLLRGRAGEVEVIVANCALNRLTVVTSPPDMGISSLLRAGVAPALRRAGYVIVPHVDWEGRRVAQHLREATVAAIQDQADGAFFAEGERLPGILALARKKTGRPVALLLDQFEDYLRMHSSTDVAETFDAELSHAINARDACFVIGIHDSGLTALERFSHAVPNLLGYRRPLEPLNGEAAAELIRALAANTGLEIEDEAVAALITESPLLLTLAAEELFAAERRLGSKRVRLTIIQARGGKERLAMESLDAAFNNLGATYNELLFRWAPLLEQPAAETALMEHSGKWSQFARILLAELTRTGFLRTLTLSGQIQYELARHASAAILRDWWTRKEAELAARERAKFRVRSISIAGGAILAAYLIYLVMTWKK